MTALAQSESATPSTASPKADIDATTVAPGGEPDVQHPAVGLVGDWLDAMQTADDAAFVQFMQEHAPGIPGTPEQWLLGKRQLRGLRLHSVISTTPGGAELWLFDPHIDSYILANAKLQPGEPSKIASLMLQPTERLPPGAAPPPKLQGEALIDAVRERAKYYVERGDFEGAILIAKGDQVLFQEAYGFADREARKPNELHTQFRFGSMGKMFVIVAMMQLVEDGKVELAAPIGRYLPGYPDQDIATKVTVANLLTHTGGTGDIFGPEFQTNRTTLRDLRDYVDLYGERPALFEAGSRYAYSNYGFILLGRIVEEVSGLSYDDYLEQIIFAPGDMRSTGHLPESATLPRRAVAYMGAGSNLRRADETLPFRGTSAGGGYSTAGDLHRFIDAVVSHQLLKADTLRTLISGGITTADGEFHRYDFGGTVQGTGRFVGHGGGAPGMNGDLKHFLDSGYTLIVLANRDPNVATYVSNFVARRLPAE
jgi:CubicO group peptidase (beta-lactamase class C family)